MNDSIVERYSRRPAVLLLVLLAWAVAACGSATDPDDPSDASYSGQFDPPLLALATEECDRFLTDATLFLSDQESSQSFLGEKVFELSVGLEEDCTRGDGEITQSRRVLTGEYLAVEDGTLLFGAPLTSFPEFRGTFDGEFVELELPDDQAWPALGEVSVELGPRTAL